MVASAGFPNVSPADVDAGPGCALETHRFADSIAQFAVRLQSAEVAPAELTMLIVEGAVKLIPGAEFAAVLSMTGKHSLRSVISTGEELPGQLLDLQNVLGEGPCRDTIATGAQTRVTDMTTECRWPEFAPAAAALGVVGMLSTPMLVSGRSSASLTLIATRTPFDDEGVSLAKIFAVHAAIALSGAVDQEALTAALSNRDVIGQAKGILMERFQMTGEAAFAALVKVSADNNIKLRVVCDQLCQTGVLVSRLPRQRPAKGC